MCEYANGFECTCPFHMSNICDDPSNCEYFSDGPNQEVEDLVSRIEELLEKYDGKHYIEYDNDYIHIDLY